MAGRALRNPLYGHTGWVNGVAFGRLEGRTVLASAGNDETVRLWDPVAGRALRNRLYGHSGRVNGVAFGTLDGRTSLGSVGTDGTVQLWDPLEGRTLIEPLPVLSPVNAIATTTGMLAVATNDTVIVLDLRDRPPQTD